MVQPARWARLVRKAWLEMMELRARKVRLDFKVSRVWMAQPARWVRLAQLVRRALQEMMERRVLQVHRAHKVRLDLKV